MTAQAESVISSGGEEYSSKRLKTPPKNASTWFKRLLGYYPKQGPVALEKSDSNRPITTDGTGHVPQRSFMNYVPFSHYDTKNQQIVTTKNERAVFLDILPANVEGLSEDLIDAIAAKIKIALDALPGESDPWIIQVYQNDEDARALIHDIKSYANENSAPDQYKENWFKLLEEHLSTLSRREGIFKDKKGMKWRARYRRVRMVIYRKKVMEPELINAQVLRLTEALSEAGVHSHRMSGKEVWTWLMPWYSGERENAYDFMEQTGYPEKEEQQGQLSPFFDLGEMCLRNRSVRCDEAQQLWQLGNRYNRFLTLEPFNSAPKTGHWVLEGDSGVTPFDRMPDGVILMYTLIIEPQDKAEAQIELVVKNSIGDGEKSRRTRKECKKSLKEMAKGHRLVTFLSGVYIDAMSTEELNKRTTKAIAAANGAGFDVIEPTGEHGDLLILDTYVRGLPMAFDPYLDKKYMKRARKEWDTRLARLLPLYTRGRGTKHHGINFNSVGGEPISFDPLGDDRSENAHLFMIGNSGTGKTTTLITMLMQLMATHNPRLYLITALPTFYLLGEYFEKQGKTVHRVQITESSQPSLPPFADITKMVTGSDNDPSNTVINDGRDYIGEAEQSAKLMITQGDEQEEINFSVQDKALVKQAIVFAAETVVKEGRNQALTEDVVKALKALSIDQQRYPSDEERSKLAKFGTIIDLYTTGMEGQLFNRPGIAWPAVDVTIVELGVLAKTGYEAKLAISLAGLMTMINHVVEKHQRSSKRNTITVVDEAQVLLNNRLIGPILNSIVARWRTFGAWLWIATQNMQQIPESSKELITQAEWWIGLCLKDDEIDRVDKFRKLPPHQRKLLEGTKKEMMKYSEGGIISGNLNTIIRIVPPPITLALAQTEKKEKNYRYKMMQERAITELEAVHCIADEIAEARRSFDG